jgi:hypothetical protein
MEYFWGLELVRPALIWIALTNHETPARIKRRVTALRWLPYLVIWLVAVFWRLALYPQTIEFTQDPNALRLVELIRATPLEGIIHLVEMVTRDFIFLIDTTWVKTLEPRLNDFQSFIMVISWALVAFSILILWIYRTRIEAFQAEVEPPQNSTWQRQATFLGFLVFLVGTAPVWLTDKFISVGMYSDRFALPAMCGAAILLVSLPTLIGFRHKPIAVVLSLLLSLAIGTHFRIANDYRWDWTRQQRFYWQLA